MLVGKLTSVEGVSPLPAVDNLGLDCRFVQSGCDMQSVVNGMDPPISNVLCGL